MPAVSWFTFYKMNGKNLLFQAFNRHHTLLQLDETPNNKKQIMTYSPRKCQSKAAHGRINIWSDKDGNCSQTNQNRA